MTKKFLLGLTVCLWVAMGTNAWAGQWDNPASDTISADVPSQPYENSDANYYYGVSNDEVTIFKYKGPGGDVVIPSTIDGFPVVSIEGYLEKFCRYWECWFEYVGAFYDCYDLTSVTIPDSVTNIGDGAFFGRYNLTSVTIGSSVTNIGYTAFADCSSLTEVTIPDGVISIGSYAFTGCSALTEVTIPDSVTSIGERAFRGCLGLTSVTIGNNVTSIGSSTFSGCSALTEVTIPDSVTTIGYEAFADCSSLASVTIGNSVTSIFGYAFTGCSALTEVTIPDSVTSIGYDAFGDCSSLIDIMVDASNLDFSSQNGVLYNKDETTLIKFPAGKPGDITIPSSVTSIDERAFRGSLGLTSVTIPNSVTNIGDWAFNGCSSLTSVTIGNSVSIIGRFAFAGCSALTEVTIPDSVTKIGSPAFRSCSNLSIAYFLGNAPIMTPYALETFLDTAPDFTICYTAEATGFTTPTWYDFPAAPCACSYDSDCEGGYSCVEGQCVDAPPTIEAGPWLAAGPWPIMPTTESNAIVLNQNYDVLWTFSDDYASCPEFCTHSAKYQAVGESTWTELEVSTDPTEEWYAYAELPVDSLQNATTYAFRFTVTDCAGQSTQSEEYYFRVARDDDGDGYSGDTDNCPDTPNGPLAGTCYNYYTQESWGSCMTHDQCQDSASEWYNWCDTFQSDLDRDGIGDVCEE